MTLSKHYNLKGLVSAFGIAGLALSLSSGSALAVTIQISNGAWNYYNGANGENLASTNPDEDQSAGSDTVTIALNTVQAYCVDLFHGVTTTSSPRNLQYDNDAAISTSSGYAVTGFATATNWTSYQVNELTWLLANAPQGSQLNSAALQIAIWEIEYDQGTQLTTGNLNSKLSVTTDGYGDDTMSFSTSTTTFSGLSTTLEGQVYTDLKNALGAADTPPPSNEQVFQLFDNTLSYSDPQSLIYLVTTTGTTTGGGQGASSPEPGTVSVLGAGLAALWSVARRRRRA